MASPELTPSHSRRSYSRALKAQIIAECGNSKKSIAGVALAHGINANIVHKWIRLHRRGDLPLAPRSSFVTVPIKQPSAAMAPQVISVAITKSAMSVTVSWPASEAAQCAAWLRDWLR